MSSSLRFVSDKRSPAPPPPLPPLVLPPPDPGAQYATLTSYVAPPNYPILPFPQGFYGPCLSPYIYLGAALLMLKLLEQVPHANEAASPSPSPKPQPESQVPSCPDQCETDESHPQTVPIGTSLNSTIKAIETRLQKFETVLEVTAQRILEDQRQIEKRILKMEIALRNFQNTIEESTKHLSNEGNRGMNIAVSNAIKDTMFELGQRPESVERQTAETGASINTYQTCVGTEKDTAMTTDASDEVAAEERDVALMIDAVPHCLEAPRKILTSVTIQTERSTPTSSAGHVNGLSIGDAQDAVQRRSNVLPQQACLVPRASRPCHSSSVSASRLTSVSLKRKLDAAGVQQGRHTERVSAKSYDLHTISNDSNIGEPSSPVSPGVGRSVLNPNRSQPPLMSVTSEDGLDSSGENAHNGDNPDATTSSSATLPVAIAPMVPAAPVERQYKCPHGCGRSYTHRRDLRHHVNNGVGTCVMPKLRHWCLNDCGRSYACRKTMKRHLKKCLEARNNDASDSVKRMKAAEERDETSGEVQQA